MTNDEPMITSSGNGRHQLWRCVRNFRPAGFIEAFTNPHWNWRTWADAVASAKFLEAKREKARQLPLP